MQIGVSSYSFSQTNLDMISVIDETKEMGFDTIEFFAGFPTPKSGQSYGEFAKQARELCESRDLPISGYTVGADFLNVRNGDWQTEAERLKQEVEVARILGVPAMRHDVTRGFPREQARPRGFSDAVPILAKACRAVTEYAAERGIKTMIENHGFFAQDSTRVEQLVNAVNHENFGVLLDIGNFLCVDEDPSTAVGRLLPYVFHVHAKDFHTKPGTALNPGPGWFSTRGGNLLRGAIIGHGDVPLLQCLRLLQGYGYDGTVSIEFEGIEEPLQALQFGAANLRKLIKAAAAW